jgi:DNA polymerase-3 subunit delta
MILKSFEIDKINKKTNQLILFYGKNEGLKNEALSILSKDEKQYSKL